MGEYNIPLDMVLSWTLDYNTSDSEGNPNYTGEMCPDTQGGSSTIRSQRLLVSMVLLLIFLLGSLGNLLVMVILWRYRRSRTSTELFLFHLALANFLLVLTFPFGVVESLAGWVFGTFLCKALSATHRINFYSSSLLLGCISVDRYLAVVYAIRTFQKQRTLSVHMTCLAVWLLSLLLAMPDLLFTEVWEGGENFSVCHFKEYGDQGFQSWLATRFLYHVVGFFLPSIVMCYCYTAIVRALCQSQRLQRQKAVKVAILVTSIFLVCWTPYHMVIFWDTLTRLEADNTLCALEYGMTAAIITTEMVAFSYCCLNPILYGFVGIQFRHDACRILHDLGCLSQSALQEILGSCRTESTTETNISVGRHPTSTCTMNLLATSLGSGGPSASPQGSTGQWLRQEGWDLD